MAPYFFLRSRGGEDREDRENKEFRELRERLSLNSLIYHLNQREIICRQKGLDVVHLKSNHPGIVLKRTAQGD